MAFLTRAAFGALLMAPAMLYAQTAPQTPPPTDPTQPAAPATTAPGAAAATATPTVGATVYDSAGAVVGTIDQVTPQAVVVNVDNNKVSLPPASIGSGPRGLSITLTRAQVVAAAQQAQAGAQQQLQSQLTPGATVRGSAGTVVGTVKSADAQFVTLTTTKGGEAKLPMSGFGMGASGPVIGMTASELDAAVTAAGGSTTPASSETTTDSATTRDGATTTTESTTKTTTRPRSKTR